uniref:BAG family molecular chaperone regulator 2 n=1 Tax=Glossina morsitans morsitans TaxID=37546 RepID=A0A1B0G4P6_GLOMM
MEIDHSPPSDIICQSESSANFDDLKGLRPDTSVNSTCSSRPQERNSIAAAVTNRQTDNSKVVDKNFNLNEREFSLNERFVTILDQLDARVEKFRKDALNLQEKRDFLYMSIDLIKSNDLMQNLTDSEREDIDCYLQRVNARLSTVELNVRTIRDHSQVDSLNEINTLIDLMITMGDPVLSRQRCQLYLNACCSVDESVNFTDVDADMNECNMDVDVAAGHVDKKFESVLLGCTVDDQKNIKKRLHALMGYLNQQIINQ